MSQGSIEQFWGKVESDEVLRREFDALMTSDANVPAEAIVALGAKHGLAFTSAELEATLKQAAGGELSDEQLEAVAGGRIDKSSPILAFKVELGDTSYKISYAGGFSLVTF